jgi:hypothetical protein
MVLLLKIKYNSSLHLSFRHFLEDLSQIFHFFYPEMSLDDSSGGHVEDLKGFSLVAYSGTFDDMLICNLVNVSFCVYTC